MRRREFCKMMAAAAAATAVPVSAKSSAQTAEPAPPETMAPAQASGEAAGFGAYTQDYAQFCATPQSERVFYALEGGKIISEKLDEASWKPTGWIQPPDLPIPGGSWDGVPMESPIPNLGGRRPLQAHLGFAAAIRCPRVVSRRQVRYLGALESAVRARSRRLVCARDVHRKESSRQYKVSTRTTMALHPASATKISCAQWTLLNWQPDELIERYKKAGASLFVALANHHDGFDTWNSKHQPWNAVNIGPHRDVVGEPGPRPRASRVCASASPCTRRETGGGSKPPTARTKPVHSLASRTMAISTAGRRQRSVVGGLRSTAALRAQASLRRPARPFLM